MGSCEVCSGCLHGECGQDAHTVHPNGCLHNPEECSDCIFINEKESFFEAIPSAGTCSIV